MREQVSSTPRAQGRGDLVALALLLVWLAQASGAVVSSEPAPFDILMLALVFLLPLTGLAVFSPGLVLLLCLWLIVTAGGLAASAHATELGVPVTHTLVTLYLALIAFVLAGFVLSSPERHARLIMNGCLWAGVIAAAAGVIGYLRLVPGAYELFTRYDRATGTFKDANVFGAFLVPALVYAVHGALRRPLARATVPVCMSLLLALGILLSFSRGAWLNLALSLAAYGGLSFLAAATNVARIRLFLCAFFGVILAVGLLTVVSQVDEITKLLEQRASLDQSHDFGPEGRFAGHLKALDIALANPLGVGAREFATYRHHEDVHQVYISMLLNAGWVGGLLYLGIVVITLAAGAGLVLRRSPTQDVAIVAWSCFLGVAIEGLVIDTDHWRHFFVLLALIWGLMAAAPRGEPAATSAIAIPGAGARRRPISASRPGFRRLSLPSGPAA